MTIDLPAIEVKEIPYKSVYLVRIPLDPTENNTVLTALDKLFSKLSDGACVTLTADEYKLLMDNIAKVQIIKE